MRLHCGEVLYALRHKPILIPDETGMPSVVPPTAKQRRNFLAPILPLIHGAEKFIFDSGSDQDERTVMAVRETAVNMIEAGLFHQPHPLIWVEDPYEDAPETQRHYYLGHEKDDGIIIRVFTRMSQKRLHQMAGLDGVPSLPDFSFHPYPLYIDLREPSDQFTILGLRNSALSPIYSKVLGEAVYSYKKLIVTLASTNPEIERVRPKGEAGGDSRHRAYDHRIIRIPLDTDPSERSGPSKGTGVRRRRHLVRGYVFGRFTRPVEQQHWVKPYWRGDRELGISQHSHYELRAARR